MKDLQIFNSPQFGEIRTFLDAGNQPFFCLIDLCRVLELSTNKVSQRLDDWVLSRYPIIDALNRERMANFVNEDGLYDVILDSRKPEAKKFRKWITSEVLPAIRKTGGYISANENDSPEEIMAKAFVVLALIGGFNGNGNGLFGGNNNNNSADRELLASMIQRNGTDLSQLAQTIGCSNSRVQDAIGHLATQISNFAGQNGLSFQQVINSIQSGNASIIQSICDCCCKTQNAITTMGYENQLANCQQTNTLVTTANTNAQMLRDSSTANTNAILSRIDAMERASLNDKIDALREKNAQQAVAINNYQQTQTFGAMITQATQPIAVAVNNLQSDVDGIKCRLPRTEVIPATPDYVAINKSINIPYGPYCGVGFGANYNNGCCGNAFAWG